MMRPPASPQPGLVCAESSEASAAGAALLAAGGNAVDAAVAAALAETIVAPHNAGIGGFAGQMLVYRADTGQTHALRFDTLAPAAAMPGMFVGRRREHRSGPSSVGVPGVLRGLETAVLRFGSRPWRDVVEPARQLAEDGVVLGAVSAAMMAAYRNSIPDDPGLAAMLMPEGRLLVAGERIRYPDLARSLGQIADAGADAFYRGPLGEATVRCLREAGGLLSMADLAAYQTVVDAPLAVPFGAHEALVPGLPGGGLTALQCLRILEHLPPPRASRPVDDPVYLHHLIQTMKLAWRDRLTHMADPAAMACDPLHFVSDAHTRALAERILDGRVAEDFRVPADFSCTSHVSAGDRAGNLVTVTYTHGLAYGAMVVPPGTGIILGHGMARFDADPTRPNAIAPGKRALHNLCPMMVLREGRPCIAVGWTGGRRIPNVVLQVVENLTRFAMPPAEAMAAPNLHTEGANPVRIERGFPEATLAALQARGHRLETLEAPIGFGAALVRGEGSPHWEGFADPRRAGVVLAVD